MACDMAEFTGSDPVHTECGNSTSTLCRFLVYSVIVLHWPEPNWRDALTRTRSAIHLGMNIVLIVLFDATTVKGREVFKLPVRLTHVTNIMRRMDILLRMGAL